MSDNRFWCGSCAHGGGKDAHLAAVAGQGVRCCGLVERGWRETGAVGAGRGGARARFLAWAVSLSDRGQPRAGKLASTLVTSARLCSPQLLPLCDARFSSDRGTARSLRPAAPSAWPCAERRRAALHARAPLRPIGQRRRAASGARHVTAARLPPGPRWHLQPQSVLPHSPQPPPRLHPRPPAVARRAVTPAGAGDARRVPRAPRVPAGASYARERHPFSLCPCSPLLRSAPSPLFLCRRLFARADLHSLSVTNALPSRLTTSRLLSRWRQW